MTGRMDGRNNGEREKIQFNNVFIRIVRFLIVYPFIV